MTNLTDELQRTWHVDIPISKAMAIEIAAYEVNVLTITAALEPNINVHGTAFAGSLYAVAALCGWGSAWLQMKKLGIDASIVIAEGHINYFKPVQDTIQVRCQFDEDFQRGSITTLNNTGKCRIQLVSEVFRDNDLQASFSGSFAVQRIQGLETDSRRG